MVTYEGMDAMRKERLYTVGYQRMGVAGALIAALHSLGASWLLDVRSRPQSRQAWARGGALAQSLQARGLGYVWVGDSLGGMGAGPTTEGLAMLARLGRGQGGAWGIPAGSTLAIMCLEESPGECHRHHAIGLPLAREGVPILHLYRNELIEPVELQRAIDADDEYECELVA